MNASSRRLAGTGEPPDADARAAYDRAVQLLARRARSRVEVASDLERHGVDRACVAATLSRLDAERLLDDTLVGEAILREATRRGRGPGWVALHLDKRGVERHVRASVLEQSRATARTLAVAALAAEGGVTCASDRAQIERVCRRLARRGFDADLIRAILNLDEGWE